MKKNQGFTLMELMISVAVVGILVSIAYPSYTQYIKRTHRAEIAGVLTSAAQSLERFYTQAGQYSNQTTGTNPLTFPDPVGNTYYTLVVNRQATSFTLTANPVAAQMMNGDACGSFQIDNTGLRSNPGATGGTTVATCWGR